MGICLDTEANAAQDSDDISAEWKGGGGGQRSGNVRTPASAHLPMQNLGKVKFDPPKVPVIFVLGGPGSGKVTHCDTLMQEKRGVTHINMMDLLQQYAMGNDMQDFSQLSSKTVTEVLMLEMKMAPAAKAYLVSGYPRSMRDVVEYTEKIQVVNGVILISWRQAVLQKQIDYGAKLGHVVLSLAKMELENFFKNVMPVADYFDQSDMLIAVNGERSPSEVYKDFRTAVLDILGAQENQEALLNGVAGIGRGVDDIPGSIVSVETAPSKNKVTTVQSPIAKNEMIEVNSMMGQNVSIQKMISRLDTNSLSSAGPTNQNPVRIPPVIWVIGGPGSNKAMLCLKAVSFNAGWGHISVGRLLRAVAESDPKPNTENYHVKQAIMGGEMVPKKSIERLLDTHMKQLSDRKGIIIDGYPRDLEQISVFETKYKQKPPLILLDCSKLQLGRGRLDDTVSSFRRRLELFRELTLPMLKQMDTDGRLAIVDGDTDSPSVQREFEKVIRLNIQKLNEKQSVDGNNTQLTSIGGGVLGGGGGGGARMNGDVIHRPLSKNNANDTVVQDLEDIPQTIPTISHHVSLTNGHLRNNSETAIKAPGHQQNGHIANGRPNFRNMLEESENFPIDSHI